MSENEAPLTLDELMDLDPLDMTTDNIDAIVTYHRRMRLKVRAGEPAVEGAAPPKPDLEAMLGLTAPIPDPNFKRRF